VVDERIDLSRGANEGVIATDIRRRGEKLMRNVNFYDQNETESGQRERPARKLNLPRVIRLGGTVLPGDFNTHSKHWDPRCQVNQNVAFWEDVIDENGLEIGNDDRSTHHWARENQEGELVINLMLANQPTVQLTILVDVHSTGSDHEVEERDVAVDMQEAANCVRVVGWKLASMTEKDEEAVEKLWMELVKEMGQLHAECSEDKMEEEAACWQEAMSSGLDATAENIRICSR